MKENIKKFTLSMLASLMLVSCLAYKPIDAISAQTLTESQEITARANEISDNLMDYKILSALNSSSFAKGRCVFKAVTNFARLSLQIMKLSGVFGQQEDWRITAINNINNRLSALDGELGNINKHLDQIEKSINEQLSSIGEDVSKINITLAKNNITDVALVAKQISDKINSYENVITSNLVSWYEVDDNPTYNRKLNVSYLVNPKTGESKTVYLSKDLINETLEEAEYWDANRKEELVKSIFVEAMKKVLDNPSSYTKTYSDFSNYCLTVTDKNIGDLQAEELDTVLEQFSDAAYDTLRYECTKKIAKAKEDDANTYASSLVGLFTTYCDYLSETNNTFTSPLRSQYEVYSNIYAFQGELKCQSTYTEDGVTHTEDTNLASIAREKYFAELNTLGAFVAEIANASGAYTTEDLFNNIYLPWSTSEAALNEAYNEFYHMDVNGNEIDNYCYVTDSVLKYGINNVELSADIGFKTYESSGKRHVDSKTKAITRDWTTTIDNNYILTNNQLLKIYAYFVRSRGKTSGLNFDFYQYLHDYKVCDDLIDETYIRSPLIITGFNGGADLGSSDKVTMLVWPFYADYNEKYVRQSCGGKYDKINDTFYKEVITGSTGEMVVKRKALANTFNPLNGEANTNTNVGTVAIHFHDYKTQDDIALLLDGEYMPTRYMFKNPYNGADDTALNYNANTALNFKKQWYADYNTPDYDTKTGQENMKQINYRRGYGSIISNDLDVYATNGKISNTNSIEVIQNNNTVVNNYVKNVSFSDGNYLVNDAIKNDQSIKDSYLNVSSNAREKFEKLLEALYPGKTEEIEKLKANKFYSISFDNDNCTNVDNETYKAAVLKLIEYLKPDSDGNNANINSMISTFRDMYSEIIKTIDVMKAENNVAEIVLSNADYNKLIETIISENVEEEFSICEKIKDIPKTKNKSFIYCEEDGEIYVWNKGAYVKYSSVKQTYTYAVKENGTVIVSDDVYTTNTIPDEFKGDYIYNSNDNNYYKWNEVVVAENYGHYEEITNIKATSPLPLAKETDYLYEPNTKEFYEWKKELKSQYVKLINVPTADDLNSYVDQVVKYDGEFYKWATVTQIGEETTEEIVVEKYIEVKTVNELPTTMDEYYLVYGKECYKFSTIETNEKYVKIDNVPEIGDIVTLNSLPSEYQARFILVVNKLVGNKFYKWIQDEYKGEISGYKKTNETVKKFSELKTTTTDPINPVEVDIFPSTLSKQLKLVYEVKPTISFELYFDREIKDVSDVEKADISYNVIPYYDITPMLTWKDAHGNQKYLRISDDVLKKANIGPITVKIPVVQMNNKSDVNALIYHFENMEQTTCPIDEYTSRIFTNNDAKYATISTNSFSPFTVKKTYTVNKPSKRYDLPKTGIK